MFRILIVLSTFQCIISKINFGTFNKFHAFEEAVLGCDPEFPESRKALGIIHNSYRLNYEISTLKEKLQIMSSNFQFDNELLRTIELLPRFSKLASGFQALDDIVIIGYALLAQNNTDVALQWFQEILSSSFAAENLCGAFFGISLALTELSLYERALAYVDLALLMCSFDDLYFLKHEILNYLGRHERSYLAVHAIFDMKANDISMTPVKRLSYIRHGGVQLYKSNYYDMASQNLKYVIDEIKNQSPSYLHSSLASDNVLVEVFISSLEYHALSEIALGNHVQAQKVFLELLNYTEFLDLYKMKDIHLQIGE